MSRALTILGNWKMHHGPREAAAYARAILGESERFGSAVVGLFPPFPALPALGEALGEGRIDYGGQSCHAMAHGAFTGEVAPEMLRELGCRWVLVGHSERRQLFGEDDEVVHAKLRGALRAGLAPVLCVGETREEREGGLTEEVLARQVSSALVGIDGVLDPERGLLLAYEPVWAIGTGLTASPAQAAEAHAALRAAVAEATGDDASALPILYGGSVKPHNVAELVVRDEIDGALVGGASLDPETFAELIANALAAAGG